ncbi:hypothetical protein [Streptomyces sp. NPDC057257]|uniref:hypothetical protein n=1 Tax=Streptomyces sp. NPDC057257 TaxID=3346071 RepID=UPI003638D329
MLSESTVRIVWGSVLLALPGSLHRRCTGTSPTATARTAVRALGLRHVLQGALTARGGLPTRWAAVPDVAHASTMAVLALRSNRWRAPALADVLVAGAFAVSALRGTAAVTVFAPRPRVPQPPASS